MNAPAIALAGVLSLLGIALPASATTGPAAQIAGGNLFLGTTKVEAGARPNGSLGSNTAAPTGFSPLTTPGTILGLRANPAECGWASGDCTTLGDFFTPGIPHEGWGIQIGDGAPAFNGNAGTEIAGGFTSADAAAARGVWRSSGPFGGAVAITQTYAVPPYAWTVDAVVELTNTSASATNDVYLLRGIDPDNCRMETRAVCDTDGDGDADAAGTSGAGVYTTHNRIVSQGSAAGAATVSATQANGAHLFLRAPGAESRVFVRTTGGFGKPASIAAVWAGNDPVFRASPGSTFGDVAIYAVTRVPSIAPGATATVRMQYVLTEIPAATDFTHAVGPSGALIDARLFNVSGSVVRGICSAPANGSATIEGGRLRYVPDPGFRGTDSFSYSTGGPCGTVTISASTTARSAPPVARLAPPRRTRTPSGDLRLVQRLRLARGGRYTFIYVDPSTGRRVIQQRGSTLGARRLSTPSSAPILRTRKAARNVVLSSVFAKRLPAGVKKRMRLRVVYRALDGTLMDATPGRRRKA